ncbi:hypothetical protein NC653_028400 [Populus alba x Populus x berolinensis]|uniref:Uncharacterized protein n=1 Tax=Populus alba x Populus x berolinensis TaxID=444605 RepID=A0AAD6M812_9ROSI|nr:hypothetical protein NC653_028400 [Populus alba x Populus x berolinensis]
MVSSLSMKSYHKISWIERVAIGSHSRDRLDCNSAVQAMSLLISKGVPESNIIFLNLISTSEIETGLNEDFRVVPGMGITPLSLSLSLSSLFYGLPFELREAYVEHSSSLQGSILTMNSSPLKAGAYSIEISFSFAAMDICISMFFCWLQKRGSNAKSLQECGIDMDAF